MTFCFFLKILSELSIYFIVANCLLSVGLIGITSIIPMVVCAAVGAFAYWLDEKKTQAVLLKFLVLALMLPTITIGESFGTYLVLILPVVYVALTVITRRYYIDRDSQVDFFRNGCYAVTIMAVPFVILMSLEHIVPFIVVYIFSGIFLLRTLRQDKEILKEKKYRIYNFLQIFGIFAASLIFSSNSVLQTGKDIFLFFYNLLLSPVVYLLAYIAAGIATLFGAIFKFFFPDFQPKYFDAQKLLDIMFAQTKQVQEQYDPGNMSDTLILLGRGVIVLACIVTFVVFFISRTRGGKNKDSNGNVHEFRSAVTFMRPDEEKIYSDHFPPREPRAAVRYYYRKFLRLCQQIGKEFPPHYNSLYIQNMVSGQFKEETLKSMRETYILARYSKHDISKDDVEFMKEQFKNLKQDAASVLLDDKDRKDEIR